jgi:hypothetical protein
MKRIVTGIAIGLVAAVGCVYGRAERLPAGTNIEVRTNETIEIKNSSDGRIFNGVVAGDVADADGNIAIPRGSNVELIVRNVGDREMAVDLESIAVGGERYTVSADDSEISSDRRQGVGKNKRTGEFVGGGAVLGTILGAIAGGGKGAAIGAVAGGAAGAGAQTVTRGKTIRVPAETVLSFRLNAPLRLGADPDRGVTRGDRHYHDER